MSLNRVENISVKKSQVEISASIMCIDWLNVKKQLNELELLEVEFLHWDIIDGSFAPDFTMGSSIINRLREEVSIPSDYHLMVEEPSRLFNSFEFSENDILTIHQECSRNLHRDLIRIRNMGCRVGVAISPGTPLEALDYVIEDIDVVLLMTVNPGFKGQKLVPQTIRKIEDLKKLINNYKLDCKIEVDGSVSPTYISQMVEAGADMLVGGSSGLFRANLSLEESVGIMRQEIHNGLSKRK